MSNVELIVAITFGLTFISKHYTIWDCVGVMTNFFIFVIKLCSFHLSILINWLRFLEMSSKNLFVLTSRQVKHKVIILDQAVVIGMAVQDNLLYLEMWSLGIQFMGIKNQVSWTQDMKKYRN